MTQISKLTLLAAALMGLTTLVHVFAGGPEVHTGLLAAVSDPGLAAFVSILWHFVTVFLGVATLALAWLARHPDPALEATLAALQIGAAALFIFYGAIQLGTLWLMPQWVIFLLIPLLTRIGQRGVRPTAMVPRNTTA